MLKKYIIILILASITSCTSYPPIEVSNICDVLDEEVSWYKAVRSSEKKWGVPKHLMLAFIHQESRFSSDARPPRGRILGSIPWFRDSSAYGFGQVKDKTWQWYQLKADAAGSSRSDFVDVADFIGFYVNYHAKTLKIAKDDTYHQYLAYHEGGGGFSKSSYKNKPWLIGVAKSVAKTANKYQSQLKQCHSKLEGNSVWSFF